MSRKIPLAEGTVRNHVSAAMAKTNTENRIGAVRTAQEMGRL